MNTTTTPTKVEEFAAVRALADQLGAHSYLGPWLSDALPWLADQLRCDYLPQRARAMAEEAARVRSEACCDAIAIRQTAQLEARRLLEGTATTAEQLKAKAEAEADRIRGRAWQAIRLAVQELER
jgi:hypothetical protein